ncbi:hypothetical protein JW960_08980 [candidate division KSB1 bacterium]|nr:hypothetical protein [candidate division KSB1 bacterium]
MIDQSTIKAHILQLRNYIALHGAPWSQRLIDSQAEQSEWNKSILPHPFIQTVIIRLSDPAIGIPSISANPASFQVYGSYYWTLRFLADIGIIRNDIDLDPIITPLFRYQLEDGQFTSDYRTRNKIPVANICHTAHLTASLVKLGYGDTPGVRAAYRYILTTQRFDGGWHCDMHKQAGERDESASSCPAATIHVLRALTMLDDVPQAMLDSLSTRVLDFWQHPSANISTCDPAMQQRYHKLRYPSHYWGYDLLHIADTVSLASPALLIANGHEIVYHLLEKCPSNGFVRSDKTIPEWKEFDFARKNKPSCWISAMIVRILERVYFNG